MKKSLLLSMSLAMFLGVGVAVGAHQNQKAEMVKADATAVPSFARFYFVQGTWGESSNPVIGKQDLKEHFDDATEMSLTSVESAHAPVVGPNDCYYYIDYEIEGPQTLYFRFVQDDKNVYPKDHGYSGYIGNAFYPGFIYTITAGAWSADEGNNKWCTMTVDAIGYFGTFNVNGGTRNAEEHYDYKEFRKSATTMAAPTREGYTFNGWLCEEDKFVTKAGGTFGATKPFVMKAQWVSNTQQVVAADRTRLWIGYNGTIDQVYYKEKAAIFAKINGVEYAPSGTYYNMGEHIDGSDDCPRRYDYFDIPSIYYDASLTLNIVRRNPADLEGEPWSISSFYAELKAEDHAFKVLYCPATWESDSFVVAGLSATDSLLATLGLCGIHSCSSSALNGYGNYDLFYNTFVQSDEVATGMSAYTVQDFANGDTSYAGSRENSVKANVKLQWVKFYAGKGEKPSLSSIPYNAVVGYSSAIVIVIILATFGFIALGLTFLFKKRKER